MGRLNADPLTTFPDGSRLLVSTRYSKETSFSCELYVAIPGEEGRSALRLVSHHFEATTCLQAQEIAYGYAQRLYPATADGMKKPPYLIWQGPAPHT